MYELAVASALRRSAAMWEKQAPRIEDLGASGALVGVASRCLIRVFWARGTNLRVQCGGSVTLEGFGRRRHILIAYPVENVER